MHTQYRIWLSGLMLLFVGSFVAAQQPPQPMPPKTAQPKGPTAPQMPPGQQPLTPVPGMTPPTPGQPPIGPLAPGQPDLTDTLLAQSSARGTEAERTAFPTVFGDLLGGGTIAGPLPVFVNSAGDIFGPPVRVVLADGSVATLSGAPPRPVGPPPAVDDLIRLPADQVPGLVPPPPPPDFSDAARTGLLPPPGTTFEEALAPFVARVPTYVRGAFKVTENDTPRPTTRAYMTYNFYDQVFAGSGFGFTPRVMLHQQVFGFEYANESRTASLSVRLPYNQLVAPGLVSDTGIGDMTLISKVVIWENNLTGNLLSGGLALTVPTGHQPFANTITGQKIRGSLIQPWMGYIYNSPGGDWFTQGFNSLIIPTDQSDATFMANTASVGYWLYRNSGTVLTGIVPVAEIHTNIPFSNSGLLNEPIGFVNSVNILAGSHFFIGESLGLGFAAGAPITGPRPFSLQGTFQVNWRF